VIKGLFFHETKRRLADGYKASAYSASSYTIEEQNSIADAFKPLLPSPINIIGSDVLRYRFRAAPDHPNLSICMLFFFKGICFVGRTCPVDEPEPPSRKGIELP
jgi:hypothetical protein